MPWRIVPVYRTASEEETIALGERLAHEFKPGTVVLLIGNLGFTSTAIRRRCITSIYTGWTIPQRWPRSGWTNCSNGRR